MLEEADTTLVKLGVRKACPHDTLFQRDRTCFWKMYISSYCSD